MIPGDLFVTLKYFPFFGRETSGGDTPYLGTYENKGGIIVMFLEKSKHYEDECHVLTPYGIFYIEIIGLKRL